MNRSTTGSKANAPDVARQLRLLRERKKISQKALAEASGLSRNTLSLLERGYTSPTLATLQKIADALNVSMSEFFQDSSQPDPTNDNLVLGLSDSAPKRSLNQETYRIDGLISALILHLEPKAKCGSLLPHGGEEFIYCLSGRCLISVDQQNHVLEPGDSLLFDGRFPHYCQSLSHETTKALVIFFDITSGELSKIPGDLG